MPRTILGNYRLPAVRRPWGAAKNWRNRLPNNLNKCIPVASCTVTKTGGLGVSYNASASTVNAVAAPIVERTVDDGDGTKTTLNGSLLGTNTFGSGGTYSPKVTVASKYGYTNTVATTPSSVTVP